MTDNEKVIQRLNSQIALCKRDDSDWISMTVWDAKKILKLIEGRKPIEAEMEGGYPSWWYVCGECHSLIGSYDKYCRICGRELLWDQIGGKEKKE